MDTLLQDLRYALRQLRKAPGFTLTAVLTLALGIGANIAIFTLVHGILLRSLPVTNPAQLYRIGDTDSCCVEGGFVSDNGDFDIFSYDLYLHLKNSAPEFEQLAAMQAARTGVTVRRGSEAAKPLHSEFVSGNYFSTLGVGAFSGRPLTATDDTPSAAPAAVISYRAWQAEFAADPALVGSKITIQAKPFTVVGIAPPGFFGDRITDVPPDFWMPLAAEPYVDGDRSVLHESDENWLYALGRVRPGTPIAALQAKLSVALRQWLATRPLYTDNGGSAELPKQHVVIVPGGGGIQNLQQQTGDGLKMTMILSCVVLLIACANIASLMLARATTRRADLAMRTALGAARRRLIRQILTECVVLSCIGGLAGLAVAYAGARVILSLAFPDAANITVDATPSLPVLGFAFLISLFTGVLLGTAPGWLSSHAQPAEVLRGLNRSTRDRSSLPQKGLVVVQAALSMVLLAGAILMTKSLANLEKQDFGVATAHRYVLHLDLAGAGYTPERLPALYREVQDRFSALPGMSDVGLALYTPLEGDNWNDCVYRQGYPAPQAGDDCSSTWDRVSPGFLHAIGVPIIRGRGFTDQDSATSRLVVVVNQAFVKRFYPNEDPLGKHFGLDYPQYADTFEIVGVFGDFKMNNPRGPVRPVFLRPLAQRVTGLIDATMMRIETQSTFMSTILLNFSGPSQGVDALVRRTLGSIDPNLTVTDLRPFEAQVAANFDGDRLIARLVSLFGILALTLASVGLYGVMSYLVARRTGEIGVRMALGATQANVLAMVLRGALGQILVGLGLGIPAALWAGHLMASQLYGVGSYDPLALVAASLVLALCAITAGFIPARRAASIEPMQALRTE
ncbi:MAG TPA: ABC transporter permease [Candidatus Acidoferrum sp.]|nr:ABC transporter permease [Candidatus Acidoferrum sp.]